MFSKPERKPDPVVSRVLSDEDLAKKTGRQSYDPSAINPYLAGSQRYSVPMYGVDLLTGNYSTSATDLSFEGGYGMPINVSRSYSSNNPDEGPFGKGWTLSADIRSTAGGLLKSGSSGDRSVPVQLKQFPSGQTDPNAIAGQDAVALTDASGRETRIKLDVDGILNTPPWDKNVIDTVYEDVVDGDAIYTIATNMTVTTPEGTVYEYAKRGQYVDGGVKSMNFTTGAQGTGTPSNILKIISITDRHGNVTTFNYDTSEQASVYFGKLNGVAKENPLTSISMPGGRTITFGWVTKSTNGGPNGYPIKRISSASDGSRTVNYQYDSLGHLTSSTTPGSKTTSYGYGNADITQAWINAYGTDFEATYLLTSITDPRGLVTTMDYIMGETPLPLSGAVQLPAPVCYRVAMPNDTIFYSNVYGMETPYPSTSDWPTNWDTAGPGVGTFYYAFQVRQGSESGPILNQGGILTSTNENNDGFFIVRMHDWDAVKPLNGGSYPAPGYVAWEKKYRLVTLDCESETRNTYPWSSTDLRKKRGLAATDFEVHTVVTESKYNFQGNPLERKVTESYPSTVKTVYYAYHGHDKYFQQKAVKDPAGRISYTDYFDRTAAAGKKGQVYRVYDPKWTNGYSNSSGTGWRDSIVPTNTNLYSAEFDYDSVGRPTSVKKLQRATLGTPSSYEYVQTVTEYGATGSPFWGAASKVTEDYGTGKINRVTETTAYDISGRATETIDAAGKTFETDYDNDGRVESVTCALPNGNPTTILEYGYGSSGMSNGMPTSVKDYTDSGRRIEQYIDYEGSGGGIGQPSEVTEDWIAIDPETLAETTVTTYSVLYTYTDAGERATTYYSTPNGNRKVRYDDFIRVGAPDSGSRVFQTLIEQEYVNNAWQDSDEQFHYQYDTGGRLTHAAFAQTKRTAWSDPNDPDPGFYVAQYRGLQTNAYEAAGRVKSVGYTWETYSGIINLEPSFTHTKLPDGLVSYAYDATTGLRTGQTFHTVSNGSWSSVRTEEYTYDSQLDFLTGVDYNDGLANEVRTWGYDAAGNRSSDSLYNSVVGTWSYDNLNRMLTTPRFAGSGTVNQGWSYEHDILGNRTGRNATAWSAYPMRYDWDVLNRATLIAQPSGGASYAYRADGQRIEKVEGATFSWSGPRNSGQYDTNYATNRPSSRYYYDGQMGFEDDYNPSGTVTKVTRNLLGARGIDRISITENNATTHGYPLYDGHGNCRAILTKNGSSYGTGNWRTYDVWGSVRSGSATGDPKSRYVASIGHVADDESSLTYMRARYYEPATGRFINQDPALSGHNWFVYCSNNPCNKVDSTGKADVWICLLIGLAAAVLAAGLTSLLGGDVSATGKSFLVSFIAAAATAAALDAVESALELGAFDLALINFGIGGGINAIATLLIDLLTGDTENLMGDVVLAFFCGGVGGVVGGVGGGQETFDYVLGGWVMSALQALGGKAIR